MRATYLGGINYAPTDLALATKSGLGLARIQAEEGTDMDGIVAWLARAHIHLYPILGLPCPSSTTNCTAYTQIPPATAASEMSGYISAFAQRYGADGTFWAAHPKLPYMPVQRFEIGNEPNIRIIWVQDQTHLHWPNPSDSRYADMGAYAKVYTAARAALHAVDPSGVAVVGGLGDSASYGVDVESDESLLNALPRGGVDAVGYHPWVYSVSDSLLRPDTEQLRDWMDSHGFSKVPLDINEFGACRTALGKTNGQACSHTQSSQTWGSAAARYTGWALCHPWLHVANVQSFEWGGLSDTDQDVWLPLVTGGGAITQFGAAYFGEARSLRRSGCPRPRRPARAKMSPPVRAGRPSITGTATSGSRLTAHPGRWRGRPKPRIAYQWVRCDLHVKRCEAIGGAFSRRYRLQDADLGSRLLLSVTAANSAGSATVLTAPTGEIYPHGQRPHGHILGEGREVAAP
jgi:hypothetical protein